MQHAPLGEHELDNADTRLYYSPGGDECDLQVALPVWGGGHGGLPSLFTPTNVDSDFLEIEHKINSSVPPPGDLEVSVGNCILV